jgi:hypothetical protein
MELLYFILGILFVQYGIPLLDGISTWFLTWVEAKKAKQSEVINQANINMRQAATSADQDPPKRPIGFRMPDLEENEEEGDEDEV